MDSMHFSEARNLVKSKLIFFSVQAISMSNFNFYPFQPQICSELQMIFWVKKYTFY